MKSIAFSAAILLLLLSCFCAEAGELTIRASGGCGSEIMVLEVNGKEVATFTNVAIAPSDYSWPSYEGGTIRIMFTNDTDEGCDRNLHVDYITVCGSKLQTETAASRAGCGDKQWLRCNGYFDFGNPGCESVEGTEGLTIRARGNCGSETMALEINGEIVATYSGISPQTADYFFAHYTGGSVAISFVNDAGGACNRSLHIESVRVGNVLLSPSKGNGKDKCCDGNTLWWNGTLVFGSGNTGNDQVSTKVQMPGAGSFIAGANEFNSKNNIRIYPNPVSSELFVESIEAYDLYVYNMDGLLMLKQSLKDKKSVVDVSQFKKGMYLFIIKDGTQVIVEKIDVK